MCNIILSCSRILTIYPFVPSFHFSFCSPLLLLSPRFVPSFHFSFCSPCLLLLSRRIRLSQSFLSEAAQTPMQTPVSTSSTVPFSASTVSRASLVTKRTDNSLPIESIPEGPVTLAGHLLKNHLEELLSDE